MKYYYVAPDSDIDGIYSSGIIAKGKTEIPLIIVHDHFLMTKYIFDIYAHDILGMDVYSAFEVDKDGLETPLFDSPLEHTFSKLFKVIYQEKIPRRFLKPFKSEQSYEGMGLIEGVLPVETREKFTEEYKNKVLEYIEELGEIS